MAASLTLGLAISAAPATAAPVQAGLTARDSGHRPKPVCERVRADGVGQDLGGGATTATISTHGVVIGSTTAQFVLGVVTPPVAPFTGTIDFTGPGTTLSAPVVGTLNLGTGAFSSTSHTVTGTTYGIPVTGSLTFTGVEDLATGAFTETVTGRLCLGPRR